MRAWRFHEFGDLANFRLEDVSAPELRPGEVLVRLAYASLNPADRLLIEGKYPGAGQLPLTVGRDGSGTVEVPGDTVRFKRGDRVLVLRSEVGITRQGTLAELVAVPAEVLAPVPSGWSMEEAAAAPLVYLTAWKALVVQGGLKHGETILVTGASGGVGIASIQLGKALGARVVALSRDAAKRDRLQALGADAVIDDSAGDLAARVAQACGGGGPDIVIEHLGGARLAGHVAMVNMNGRVMVIGLLAGRKSELDMGMVLFKQVRIEGVHVGRFAPAEAQAAWNAIVETMEKAKSRPVLDKTFGFEAVPEAFARLSGGHLGKVLVKIGG